MTSSIQSVMSMTIILKSKIICQMKTIRMVVMIRKMT